MQRGRILLLGLIVSVMLTIGVVNRATTLWFGLLSRERFPDIDLTSDVIWLIVYLVALKIVVLYVFLLRRKMASSGEKMTLEHHRELTVMAFGLAILAVPYAMIGTSNLIELTQDTSGADEFTVYNYWAFSFLLIHFFIFLSLAILAWLSYEHDEPLLPFCIEKGHILVLTIVGLVMLVHRSFESFGWLRYYTINEMDIWQDGAFAFPSPIWFFIFFSMFIVALAILLYTWNGMRAERNRLNQEQAHTLAVISFSLMLLMFPYIIDNFESIIEYIRSWDIGAEPDEVHYAHMLNIFYHSLGTFLRFVGFLSIGLIAFWWYHRDPSVDVIPSEELSITAYGGPEDERTRDRTEAIDFTNEMMGDQEEL